MSNRPVSIIGVGPGGGNYIYPLAQQAIEAAEVLIGGRRNLAEFEVLGKEALTIDKGLNRIAEYIRENCRKKTIAVLASGDTGLFSVRAYLQRTLTDVEFQVFPGISSLQYLVSKLNVNLNEVKIITMHGSDQVNLKNTVVRHKYTAIFAGSNHLPQDIAAALNEIDFAHLEISVGENLSYDRERIVTATPAEIARMYFSDLSLVLVYNPDVASNPWPYRSMGLPDQAFIRGEVPMTKSEVRAVVLSKLRLKTDSRVLEIGAGTGSCTVEIGLTAYEGKVFAIERNPEGIELMEKNIRHFALDHIEIIRGIAPDAIPAADEFDSVFIGGSGGRMKDIISAVARRTKRIVITAITVESVTEALNALSESGFDETEVVTITVARSKKAGSKHLLTGMNPVTVITGEKL